MIQFLRKHRLIHSFTPDNSNNTCSFEGSGKFIVLENTQELFSLSCSLNQYTIFNLYTQIGKQKQLQVFYEGAKRVLILFSHYMHTFATGMRPILPIQKQLLINRNCSF
jgi:hypothetical protein